MYVCMWSVRIVLCVTGMKVVGNPLLCFNLDEEGRCFLFSAPYFHLIFFI